MADQTTTVRPNSTVAAGTWTVSPSGSLNSVTSDNNLSTYAASNNPPSQMILGVSAAGIGASLVKAVKARFTVDGSTPTAISFRIGLRWAPTGELVADSGPLSLVGVPSPTADFSAIAYQRPDGQPFTTSDVDNNLQLLIEFLSGPSSTIKVYEAYMEVQHNRPPTAIVASPAGGSTITTTTQPTLAWTYSDPENDAQERYRLKVFTGTGAVGDPDTETARLAWDSGEVVSSALSAQVGKALINGGYSWYVKAADAGSNGRYSGWWGSTFTISVSFPPAPSLAVAVTGVWVQLTVTPGVGSPAAEYAMFERSYDGGSTWESLRRSNDVSISTFPVSRFDVEARRGVLTQFRARTYRMVGGSPSPLSPPSNIVSTTIVPDGLTWIVGGSKATIFTFSTRMLIGSTPGWTSESTEDQAEYDPAGRTDYVVISGAIRGERGELALLLTNDFDWATFESVRARQEPVLLKTCYGGDASQIPFVGQPGLEQYWIRLGPVRTVTRYTTSDMRTNQRRRVTIGFRVVATPV